MSLKRRVRNGADALLKPFGVRLVPDPRSRKSWDSLFKRWIEEAKTSGIDANDIGDREWLGDHLEDTVASHYLRHITADSVVFELGPGTGRLTRHLVHRCRELICADYSKMVCAWLAEYMGQNGHLRIHHIDKPSLPMISDDSVDVIVAHGVIEHVDLRDLSFFLEEFHRILKPLGIVSFNYDNIMTPAGIEWLRAFRGGPNDKCIFHFYHPETMQWLSKNAGFVDLRHTINDGRLAHLELQKPKT